MLLSLVIDVWQEPGFSPPPMAIPAPTMYTVRGIYIATSNSIYITHVMPGDPPIVHAGSKAISLVSMSKTSNIQGVGVPGQLNCGGQLPSSQDSVASST